MTHRGSLTALSVVACMALLFSGAAHPLLAVGCLLLLGFKASVLDPRRRFIPDVPFTLLHAGLFLPGVWLALLREPPLPFFDLLVTFGGPLLVLRSLARDTLFNDFLITLVSLLLVVLSAAAAPGWMPLWITILYLVTVCQALPRVTARPFEKESGVRVRLLGRTGWWSSAPALAAHHLALGGLLLGAALYLLVPRPARDAGEEVADLADAGALAERRRLRGGASGDGVRQAYTGFPREVSLGDIGQIKQRPGLALTAEIRQRGRRHDPVAPEEFLLRARVWNRYDPGRRRWIRPRTRTWRLSSDGRIEAGDTALHWSIALVGSDQRTLFLPQRARIVKSTSPRLHIDNLGVVTAPAAVDAYTVESAPPTAGPAGLSADPRFDRLLEVPPALRRRDLARHLPKRSGTGIEASVAAIRDFFATGGFRYTLSLPETLPKGVDPILAFLERREGHCELYASAACFFLRAWGVPARVAGGYRLTERVEAGFYRAHNRNAHAWVEIACLGVGFVPFDFTPGDDRASGGPPAAAGGAAATSRGDAEAADAALDWTDPFRYGPREQERVTAWVVRRVASPVVLAPLAALLAAVVAWGVLREGRRGQRGDPLRVRAPPGVPRRTLAFYARWLKRCAAKGHRRARAQTPREFVRSLPRELRTEARAITAEFERRRYGA